MGIAVAAIVITLIAGLVAWNYWVISQPLTSDEVDCLAAQRRSQMIYEHFRFCRDRLPLDHAFKRSMRPDGSFHMVDYPLDKALSIIASHLKYKKHEWVVFLICAERRVIGLWCNKGPDSKSVSPLINDRILCALASSHGADLVIRAHNHPNPYSSNLSVLAPSDQDLRSFNYYADVINTHHMNFLDVLCERGQWLIFGESYLSSFFPYDDIYEDIKSLNGRTAADNRKLHHELRAYFQRYGYLRPFLPLPQREVA